MVAVVMVRHVKGNSTWVIVWPDIPAMVGNCVGYMRVPINGMRYRPRHMDMYASPRVACRSHTGSEQQTNQNNENHRETTHH